jgi:hypothetical protein
MDEAAGSVRLAAERARRRNPVMMQELGREGGFHAARMLEADEAGRRGQAGQRRHDGMNPAFDTVARAVGDRRERVDHLRARSRSARRDPRSARR